MDTTLHTKIAGLDVSSPFMNGAGIIKFVEDFNELLPIEEIGILVVGSITKEPREGNPGTTFYDGGKFTLNALGLPNPGLEYYKKHLPDMIKRAKKADKRVMVSIVAFEKGDIKTILEALVEMGVEMAELNPACPNLWGKNAEQKEIASFSVEALNSLLAEAALVDTKDMKIGIKLSPFSNPKELSIIAHELHAKWSGFLSFITSCNTIPNCSFVEKKTDEVIDVQTGFAGMAGDVLFPLAYGNIKQLKKILKDTDIIAAGGITDGQRAFTMLNKLAVGCQIVSAYYKKKDTSVFPVIASEYAITVEVAHV